MLNLYTIEQDILRMIYSGKTLEEIALLLDISAVELETCIRTIRRKTGATTWGDLLHIGKKLADEDACNVSSEITQERAGRIQQMISALLVNKDTTEEEKESILLARAKWHLKSLEEWRSVS